MRRSLGPFVRLLLVFLRATALAGPAHAQSDTLSSSGAGDLMQAHPARRAGDPRPPRCGRSGRRHQHAERAPRADWDRWATSAKPELQQEIAVRRRRANEEQQPLIPALEGGNWAGRSDQAGLLPRRWRRTWSLQAIQRLSMGQDPARRLDLRAFPERSRQVPARAPSRRPASSAVPASKLSHAQKAAAAALIDLIRCPRPLQLSADGVLTLPGFAPVRCWA